jgi:NAD(P)-dependent dehydrogenase (short-subunit alcohol dehydrogenase family)
MLWMTESLFIVGSTIMGVLAGKIAVITGGGSGMGEASVERFVKEGAFVFVVDRSGREKDVASRYGDKAEGLRADVAVPADVNSIFERVAARFGRLDVLFNNAGYGGTSADLIPLHENSDDHIRSMVAINLESVLFGVKYAVPLMLKAGGGSIISTASSAALFAAPTMAAYGAAKGGVTAVTMTLARELGGHNIRVNAICPGPIETPLLTSYFHTGAISREFMIDATALKRLGRPQEIANVACFLASEESSYVTGAVLPVDGGQTL